MKDFWSDYWEYLQDKIVPWTWIYVVTVIPTAFVFNKMFDMPLLDAMLAFSIGYWLSDPFWFWVREYRKY